MKKNKSKNWLRSSSISVVFSMTLVLLVLGILGFVIINANKISSSLKEKFKFSLFIDGSLNTKEISSFQKQIEAKDYIGKLKFISKKQAAVDYEKATGQNFTEFLGVNPLPNSFDVSLKPEYFEKDSIQKIVKEWKNSREIADISYDKIAVNSIIDNLRTLGLFLSGLGAIFLIIAIALINSSIRLSIYAKRFTIRTMQLVGAKRLFIIRPFVLRGFFVGLVSGALAGLIFYAGLYYFSENFEVAKRFFDLNSLIILISAMILLGILVSVLAVFFASIRHINLSSKYNYY